MGAKENQTRRGRLQNHQFFHQSFNILWSFVIYCFVWDNLFCLPYFAIKMLATLKRPGSLSPRHGCSQHAGRALNQRVVDVERFDLFFLQCVVFVRMNATRLHFGPLSCFFVCRRLSHLWTFHPWTGKTNTGRVFLPCWRRDAKGTRETKDNKTTVCWKEKETEKYII